jgi:hypothetical protein
VSLHEIYEKSGVNAVLGVRYSTLGPRSITNP